MKRFYKYLIIFSIIVLFLGGIFLFVILLTPAGEVAGNIEISMGEAGEKLSSPTSLVAKDTSGVYDEQAGENEMYEERTRNFKKFEQGGGKYRVAGQIGPIHYQKDPFSEDEVYKEIDLTTQETPAEDWDAAMETNGYQVRFWQSREIDGKTIRYIAQYRRAGKWLAMAPAALVWENDAGEKQLISKPQAVGAPTIDNDNYQVTWSNVFGNGLDFRYNLNPDEFFKTVIVNDKSNLPTPTIGTQGLKLTVVMTLSWDGQVKPGNNFASGITTNDLTDDVTGIDNPDEEVNSPETFPFKDELDRDTWWLKRPRAWDSAEEQHSIDIDWNLRRKGSQVFALLSVPANVLNKQDVVYPVYIDTDIPEEQVGDSLHDAYEDQNGWPLLSTTYLYLTHDSYDPFYGGFIFTGVPIPAGVDITSATLTIVIEYGYNDPNVNIYCEANNAPADFTTTQYDISGRTLTTNSTVWDTTNVPNPATTPSFDGAVEELVGGTWNSGDDLAVITEQPSFDGRWCASVTYDGDPADAAKFNASYTEAGTTLYWVGADTSWNTASNWSTSSGGAGDGSVPTSSDDVVFDDQDATNCTLDVNAESASFTNTNYAGTLDGDTFNMTVSGNFQFDSGALDLGTGTWTVSGDWDTSGVSFTSATSTVVMNSADKDLDTASNNEFNNLTIDGTIEVVTSGGDGSKVNSTLTVNAGKTLTILVPLMVQVH